MLTVVTWPDVGMTLVNNIPMIVAAVFAGVGMLYSRRNNNEIKDGKRSALEFGEKAIVAVDEANQAARHNSAQMADIKQAVNGGVTAYKQEISDLKAEILRLHSNPGLINQNQ